jgi:hypothetical protein
MRKSAFLFFFLTFFSQGIHAQNPYPPPVWQQMYTFTGANSFPAPTPITGPFSGCLVALISGVCPSLSTNSTQYVVPIPNFTQQPLLYNPLDKCVAWYAQDAGYSIGEWGNSWVCFFANRWQAGATSGRNTGFAMLWDSMDRSLNGTGGVQGSGMVSIVHSTPGQAVVTFAGASARFAPVGASFGILTSTDPAVIGTWPLIGASGCSTTYQIICTSITLAIPGTSVGQTSFTGATTYIAGPSESPTRPYNRHTEGQWFDEQRGAYCITTSIGDVSSTPATIWYAHTGIMDLYCAYRNNSLPGCNANNIPSREGVQSCYYWKEICGFDTHFCGTPNNVPVTSITGNGIPAFTSSSSGIGIKFPGTGRDPTNDQDCFFGGQWNSSIQHETLCYHPDTDTWVNTNPSTTPTLRWFQGDSKLVSLGKYSHKLFMAFGATNGTAGACTTNCLNETDIYDTTTNNWTIAIPNNCSNPALPPCDLNAVYDFDPLLGVVVHVDNQNPAHVWYYDPAANTWADEGSAGAPNLYPCANSGGTGGCLPSSSYPGCAATPTYYNASGAYDPSVNAFIVGIRFPNCTPGLAAMWRAYLPISIGVQADEWPGGCTACSSPQPVNTTRPANAPIDPFAFAVPDDYDVAGPTGSPLPFNTNVTQFSVVDNTGTVQNAGLNCQTVWADTGNCQWLTIDTQFSNFPERTNVVAASPGFQNLFLQQVPTGSGGNNPSTPMATFSSGNWTINTGAATFVIQQANNDFLHSVVVGSTTLLSAGRTPVTADGLVALGPSHAALTNGTVTPDNVSCNPGPPTTTGAFYSGTTICTTLYTAANDPSSTCFARNNSGVLTDLVCTGSLVNSSGDAYFQYTDEKWFWLNHSDYRWEVTLQNAQKTTTGNDVASAGKMTPAWTIRLTPNLAAGNMALTFGTGATTSATTTLTGTADQAILGQGFTLFDLFPDFTTVRSCGLSNTVSTSNNPFQCVTSPIFRSGTPSSWTYATPTGWTLTSSQSITGLASGTNAPGWAMQVDSAGNGIEVGINWMAATWPASLEYFSNGTNPGTELRIGLLPDQNLSLGLSAPQAYLQGWLQYTTKSGYMNFFTTAPASPSDLFVEEQQPLIARFPWFTYNTALPIPLVDPIQDQLYDINLSPQPSYASGATSANAGTLLADVGCSSGCFGQNAQTLTTMYRFKYFNPVNGGPNQQDIAWAAYKQWLQNGWDGYHMRLAGSQPGKYQWHLNWEYDIVAQGGVPHSDFSGNWRGVGWNSTCCDNWGYPANFPTLINLGQWVLFDKQNGGDHAHLAGTPDSYHITNRYQLQIQIENQGFPDFFSVGMNPYNTPSLLSGNGHAVPAATRSAAWYLANASTDLAHLCGVHSPLVYSGGACQTSALSLAESLAAYNLLAPAFVSGFSLPPYTVTEASNAQTVAQGSTVYPSVFTTGQSVRGFYRAGLNPNGSADGCDVITTIPCDGNSYAVAKTYQNQTGQFALHLLDLAESQYRGSKLWSAGNVSVANDGLSMGVPVPVNALALRQSVFGSGMWALTEAFVHGLTAAASGIDYLTFTGYLNSTPPCSNQNGRNCSRTTSLGGFWGENYTHVGSICQETNSTIDLSGKGLQESWDFYIERMGSQGYSELYSPEMDFTKRCILNHNLANPNSYALAADVPTLQDIQLSQSVVPFGNTAITWSVPAGLTSVNGASYMLNYAPTPIQNWLQFYPNCLPGTIEGHCPAGAGALTAASDNTGSWLVGLTPATNTPWFAARPIIDPALQTANGSYTVNCPLTSCNLDLKAYVGVQCPSGTVCLQPSSFPFANTLVGNPSLAASFTLFNETSATIPIAVSVTGTNAPDFPFSIPGTGGCGSTLVAGGSCQITDTFTPSVAALETATLNVNYSTGGGTTAAGCSEAQIQSAITSLGSTGGTVTVPSGSCSWSTQFAPTFSGPIVLQGNTTCTNPGLSSMACTDNTNITLNCTTSPCGTGGSVGQDNVVISGTTATNTFSITGFTFIDDSGSTNGTVRFSGGTPHNAVTFAFFGNHIKANGGSTGGNFLKLSNSYGLGGYNLWTETISSGWAPPITVYGDSSTGGNSNWQDATGLGTNQAIFLEGNTYNAMHQNTEGFYDGYTGCKVVVRYNYILNSGNMGTHGFDSTPESRSCVFDDVNNNTMVNTGSSLNPLTVRGGVQLFWNNTLTGTWSASTLDYFRLHPTDSFGHKGVAGIGINWIPQSVSTAGNWDFSSTNSTDWLGAFHSYTGPVTILPLISNAGNFNYYSAASCTSGSIRPAFIQTQGGNTTDGSCTWLNIGGVGASGVTGAGWSSTNPDTLVSGGTRNLDNNFDPNNYPLRDQPCVGHGQTVTPCYEWGNTGNTEPFFAANSSTTTYLQSGRDFFNLTTMPGYAPFTYPYPLIAGSGVVSSALSGTGISGTVTLSPASQVFASELVGNPSPPQTFTLTNASGVTLTSIVSSASGDFAVTGGTCGSTLGAGLSCTITVVFTPTALGLRSGTLTVTDSDASSPQTSALTGTGVGITFAASPVSPQGIAFH